MRRETGFLLLAVSLAGCAPSIPLTAGTSAPTAALPAAPLQPSLAAPVPPVTAGQPPALPSSPTPPPFVALPTPFSWEGLGIEGNISFITYDTTSLTLTPYIAHLDLAEGRIVSDWRPPEDTWLANMSLSADGSRLVIAYAPPPPEGQGQTGYTGLYLLPGSCLTQGCPGAAPQPLVPQDETGISFSPVWSPDGEYVYFTHIAGLNANVQKFDLMRIPASGGEPERLIENAIWPRLSPDGTRLAYVAYDLLNLVNDLYLAGPDGGQAAPPFPPRAFLSVDAPLFSPDGSYLYFSATGPGVWGYRAPAERRLAWLDRLMGVETAEANGAPSEWWRVVVGGNRPERLTQIATAGLSGGFSPDGKSMAFISYLGLAVLRLSDFKVVWVLPVVALGDVIWMPEN